MAKKSKRQKALEKVDKYFEEYIRIRDGWKCITCKTVIKNNKTYMHAGHYFTRGNEAVRYDEENVNAQCSKCNAKESFTSNKAPYANALINKIGNERFLELTRRANTVVKRSLADLEELRLYWKDQLERIKKWEATYIIKG